MRGEAGTVTIWVLGLTISLMFLGGFSLDLWRAFTERRLLAGMADGAVVAGASAVDAAEFRETGLIVLEPALASDRADGYLTSHPSWDPAITRSVTSGPLGVEVTLETEVDFTLLRIFLDSEAPFTVRVDSFAGPVGIP